MLAVCGADKTIIIQIEKIPLVFKNCANAIGVSFGALISQSRALFDLLPMLIGAG